MASIPIIESQFAHLFVKYLESCDYPVTEWLSNASLPVSLVKGADGFVSEYHLRKFLEDAATASGMNSLGLDVAETVSMEELGQLALEMKSAPDLHASLQLFCKQVADINSHANFWLSKHEGETWFCRSNPSELKNAQVYAEQFTVMYMVNLVRLTLGPDWCPQTLLIQASNSKNFRNHRAFRKAQINSSRNITAFTIPVHPVTDLPPIDSQQAPPEITPEPLSSTLKKLLVLYLPEGATGIGMAARIARTSVRSLKRRLAEEQTSYREIVQQVRFEEACRMLGNADISILDIANSLAYTSPGNFSRAFHRWSGVSPTEYRLKHGNP